MSEQTGATSVQWFPGHMAKTVRMMKQSLSLVDCVAEVLDARAPCSSRNPELDVLCGTKPRILLLNKSDLADPGVTAAWLQTYRAAGFSALSVDCKSGRGVEAFLPLLRRLLNEKITRLRQKGQVRCTLRVMAAGIPNVGKSAFINRLAGTRRAKTEDRPGVTRGGQWVTIGQGIELLDTPGILWPKFEDPVVGEHLAFTGAVKDDVLDVLQLASRLAEFLAAAHADALRTRYKLSEKLPARGTELLERIGEKRGMRIPGGEVDLDRAAATLLDEFRAGRLGRVSLESPETPGSLSAPERAK